MMAWMYLPCGNWDAGGTGIKEIEALQAISHRERVLLRSTDRRWRS